MDGSGNKEVSLRIAKVRDDVGSDRGRMLRILRDESLGKDGKEAAGKIQERKGKPGKP
jgi:hypothetical protein